MLIIIIVYYMYFAFSGLLMPAITYNNVYTPFNSHLNFTKKIFKPYSLVFMLKDCKDQWKFSHSSTARNYLCIRKQ